MCFPTIESNPESNQPLAFDFLRIFTFSLPNFTQVPSCSQTTIHSCVFQPHESIPKRHQPFFTFTCEVSGSSDPPILVLKDLRLDTLNLIQRHSTLKL
ncbi:hypothetical protein MTR_1g016870 [Medicago truncatula]|uniref:Uncharacterized protein n=1 Tax=Medicago truncatula TaxID=3880 RepID=A0A072VEU3_MEDTR|nr:hypothetical protein MTR_1g016870 [Medicago truncatula]